MSCVEKAGATEQVKRSKYKKQERGSVALSRKHGRSCGDSVHTSSIPCHVETVILPASHVMWRQCAHFLHPMSCKDSVQQYSVPCHVQTVCTFPPCTSYGDSVHTYSISCHAETVCNVQPCLRLGGASEVWCPPPAHPAHAQPVPLKCLPGPPQPLQHRRE